MTKHIAPRNLSTFHHGLQGFSLVELLVAMVISLLSTIIMFQVFSNFEGQRRQSVSSSDVQSGAALAQLMLGKDIKDAGFGVNDPSIYGCQAWVSIGGTTPVQLQIIPVLITDGGATGSDTIYMTKGGKVRAATDADNYVPLSSSQLTVAHSGDTSDFTVSSTAGFAAFDIVAIAQGAQCGIFEVSAVNAPLRTIAHAGGNDAFGEPRLNSGTGSLTDAVGTPLAFVNSPQNPARLFILGRKPAGGLATNDMFVRYLVQNNQLMRLNVLSNQSQPIMDDVISVQAQYGLDTTDLTNGLQIDTWTDATGPFAGTQTPVAIRIAIVVRGKQMVDKKQFPDLCKYTGALDDTTPEQLGLNNFWSDPADPTDLSAPYRSAVGVVQATLNGSAGDSNHWSCYRYRIFETTIPLRNVIWSNR